LNSTEIKRRPLKPKPLEQSRPLKKEEIYTSGNPSRAATEAPKSSASAAPLAQSRLSTRAAEKPRKKSALAGDYPDRAATTTPKSSASAVPLAQSRLSTTAAEAEKIRTSEQQPRQTDRAAPRRTAASHNP